MAAKLYGNLVGQPLQRLAQGLIGIVPPHCKDSFDEVLVRDYVTFQGNVAGDTFSIGVFRSTRFISLLASNFWNDAMAGATLNVGDLLHPTAFQNARSLAGAGAGSFLVAGGTIPAALIAAPLWQSLGYAADPGGDVELIGTLGGTAPPNGASLSWQIMGRR